MPRGVNFLPKVHQRRHFHYSIRNCWSRTASCRIQSNWTSNRLFRGCKEKLHRIFVRIATSFSHSHGTERFKGAAWTRGKWKCWVNLGNCKCKIIGNGLENKLIDWKFFVILYPKIKFLLRSQQVLTWKILKHV